MAIIPGSKASISGLIFSSCMSVPNSSRNFGGLRNKPLFIQFIEPQSYDAISGFNSFKWSWRVSSVA